MSEIASQMAELFEIEPDLEMNYSSKEKEVATAPFEKKCEDVISIMEPEPAEPELGNKDREIAEKEIEQVSKGEPAKGPDLEADQELADACDEPLKCDNPLGLTGSDLKAYREIKERYPQFSLYDGSQSFRDFYTYKLSVLKDLLSRHAVLPLNDMESEMSNIRTDHYVGESYASPMILRKKLDDSYMWRTRLLSLLMSAHSQYPSWHRMLELLHGTLWKNHDIKPAHRREGLVAEHLHGIEEYVSALKGFIKSADYLDSILKASAESLSRQIACIPLKEATGFSQATQEDTIDERESQLDKLDGFDSGSVVTAPKTENRTVDYGVDSDEFSKLGLG